LTGYLVRDAQPQHHGWMVAWHRGIVWILSNQDASPTQNGSDRPAEACTVGKLLTHPAIAKSATFTTYSIRITSLMIEVVPYPALDCLQLFGCHTFTIGKVAFISLVFALLIELGPCLLGFHSPAVILASISTLESAGINSSGSSTLS
jgi:hypothetical protein